MAVNFFPVARRLTALLMAASAAGAIWFMNGLPAPGVELSYAVGAPGELPTRTETCEPSATAVATPTALTPGGTRYHVIVCSKPSAAMDVAGLEAAAKGLKPSPADLQWADSRKDPVAMNRISLWIVAVLGPPLGLWLLSDLIGRLVRAMLGIPADQDQR
jgi:hypothetical protein